MVASEDWYRNVTWNEEVAEAFEAKLRRARRKEQYLRIQASYLTQGHPEVALALLDRFLSMPDQSDQAQAHCDRAKAHLSLDRPDDAARAYEDALVREAEFPRLLTQAWIELPLLIATQELVERYDRALALLEQHKSRAMFVVDGFKQHAARALILHARGNALDAAREAEQAREYASRDSSGFRNHPEAGLVGGGYDELRLTLEKLESAGGD